MTVGYFYWVAAPTTLAICCNFLTGIMDVTASTTLSEPRNHKSKHRPTRENSLSRRLCVVQKKICLENSALYASNCYCCFFVLLHSMETALNNTSSLEIHYCLDVPPHQRVVTCFTLCAADTHICTRCLTCETCWCVRAWLRAMHERKIRIGPWYEHMLPGR